MITSNKNCRKLVETHQVFRGSNLFSEQRGNIYVVFSYGYHFPLFIWKDDQWYGNSDGYSVSTSRHRSQAQPQADITWLTTSQLRSWL